MWTRLQSLPKWPGWIFSALGVLYWILGFVSNIDFVIQKYNDPKWLSPILSAVLDPPRAVQMVLFVLGIVWLTFVYSRRLVKTSDAHALRSDKEQRLEIRFSPREAPFEQADRHMKLFSVGVSSSDSFTTAEDVSVRLEKLEPNPSDVPCLEFTEMVFPFAEHYAKGKFQPTRSVNVNPHQTRYFEIVFMYEGMQKPLIELCFYPSKYPLDAGRYILGLRATGKNVRSDYAEFVLSVTGDGQLCFGKTPPDKPSDIPPEKPPSGSPPSSRQPPQRLTHMSGGRPIRFRIGRR